MLMVLPQYKETSEAQIARQCSIVKFAQTISEEPIVLKQVLNEQVAQREIQVMHALRDIVHIPRLLDVIDSQDGQKILVMPRYNALPPKKHDLLTISKYLSQLAKILEQVHQRGYIHMDLTPSNLMLNKEDELVLIDWGLCRDADSDESHIAGTSGYVSPEVMNGDKITTAADIYSAGIVFGQWLEVYIPDCGLNYLGSKLVRQSTTTYISKKIDDHLQNQRQKMEPEWPLIIAHAADLLKSMIRAQPEQRITAEGILRHPFITSDPSVFQGQEYESVHRLHLRRTLGGKARANREPIFIYRG
ncbi:kinase-like domain-containing protein [Gorgonomyces haynaldii]|nr:kinase-like domain-containing protein [Gorgonomyces haynaldii]